MWIDVQNEGGYTGFATESSLGIETYRFVFERESSLEINQIIFLVFIVVCFLGLYTFEL